MLKGIHRRSEVDSYLALLIDKTRGHLKGPITDDKKRDVSPLIRLRFETWAVEALSRPVGWWPWVGRAYLDDLWKTNWFHFGSWVGRKEQIHNSACLIIEGSVLRPLGEEFGWLAKET